MTEVDAHWHPGMVFSKHLRNIMSHGQKCPKIKKETIIKYLILKEM